MRESTSIMLALLLSACSGAAGGLPPLSGDPTFSWTAVTQTCDGAALTAAQVTYNIYGVPGAGPMPTNAVGGGTVPCGERQVIDETHPAVVKLNSSPLTGTGPVKLLVPQEGSWTFCWEAVKVATGSRSGISPCLTRVVDEYPAVVPSPAVALGSWDVTIEVAHR